MEPEDNRARKQQHTQREIQDNKQTIPSDTPQPFTNQQQQQQPEPDQSMCIMSVEDINCLFNFFKL